MADSVQHSAGSGKDKARTNQEQRTTLSSSPGTPPHTRDGTAHCNFIRKILNSRSFTLLTGIATLYALFGNDIKLLLVHKSADAVFTVLSSICFFLFLIELIVASLVNSKCVWKNRRQDGSDCKQRWLGISGYFLGLFFMLDLVALLALVPEIPWIWEPIVGENTETNLNTARAGRVTRAGSRAGRILRMVRLARLFKLYSVLRKKDKAAVGGGIAPQSTMGSQYSERTTKRLIVVVLLMLICVPIFTATDEDFGEEYSTSIIHYHNRVRPPGWAASISELALTLGTWNDEAVPTSVLRNTFLYNNATLEEPRLVYLRLENPADVEPLHLVDMADFYSELRTGVSGDELKQVIYVDGSIATYAWFNQRPAARERTLYNIGLTLFICVLLTLGSLQFSSDAQNLVLRPIEEMVDFVQRLARDPANESWSKQGAALFETKVLQNTIRKIANLLRVGFGAGGARVLARNLQGIGAVDFNELHQKALRDATFQQALAGKSVEPMSHSLITFVTTEPESSIHSPSDFVMQYFLPPSVPLHAGNAEDRARRASATNHLYGGVALNDRSWSQLEQLEKEEEEKEGGERRAGKGCSTWRSLWKRMTKRKADSVLQRKGGFPRLATRLLFNSPSMLPPQSHWLSSPGASEGTSHPYAAYTTSSAGFFNPWVRGERVRAIYVYLSVDKIDLITQVLRERSTILLNTLARIVHDMALSWGGTLVCGPGSTFMFCWPLPELREEALLDGIDDVEATLNDALVGLLEEQSSPVEASKSTASCGQLPPPAGTNKAPELQDIAVSVSEQNHETKDEGGGSTSPKGRAATADSSNLTEIRVDTSPLTGSRSNSRAIASSPSATERQQHLLQRYRQKCLEALSEEVQERSDRALLGVVKAILAVRRSVEINASPEVQTLRESLPGFRLSLRATMHAGWSIEGVVGSPIKIDPIYLSQHVQHAMSLQPLAQALGTNVLLTTPVYHVLSEDARRSLRLIDCVELKESATHLKLYSFDMWDWTLSPFQQRPAPRSRTARRGAIVAGKTLGAAAAAAPGGRDSSHGMLPGIAEFQRLHASRQGSSDPSLPRASLVTVNADMPPGFDLNRFCSFGHFVNTNTDPDTFNITRAPMPLSTRRISVLGAADIVEHELPVSQYYRNIFTHDSDLQTLRTPFHEDFMQAWRQAMRAYILGRWRQARTHLEKCMGSVSPHTYGVASVDDLRHDRVRLPGTQPSGSLASKHAANQGTWAAPTGITAGAASLVPIVDGPAWLLWRYLRSMRWEPPAGWKGFRKVAIGSLRSPVPRGLDIAPSEHSSSSSASSSSSSSSTSSSSSSSGSSTPSKHSSHSSISTASKRRRRVPTAHEVSVALQQEEETKAIGRTNQKEKEEALRPSMGIEPPPKLTIDTASDATATSWAAILRQKEPWPDRIFPSIFSPAQRDTTPKEPEAAPEGVSPTSPTLDATAEIADLDDLITRILTTGDSDPSYASTPGTATTWAQLGSASRGTIASPLSRPTVNPLAQSATPTWSSIASPTRLRSTLSGRSLRSDPPTPTWESLIQPRGLGRRRAQLTRRPNAQDPQPPGVLDSEAL